MQGVSLILRNVSLILRNVSFHLQRHGLARDERGTAYDAHGVEHRGSRARPHAHGAVCDEDPGCGDELAQAFPVHTL